VIVDSLAVRTLCGEDFLCPPRFRFGASGVGYVCMCSVVVVGLTQLPGLPCSSFSHSGGRQGHSVRFDLVFTRFLFVLTQLRRHVLCEERERRCMRSFLHLQGEDDEETFVREQQQQ
jgi:hypothetical protein